MEDEDVRDAGEKKEKMGIKKEMGDGRREESEEMREKEDRRGERLYALGRGVRKSVRFVRL